MPAFTVISALVVPPTLKTAAVTPVLKKPNADPDDLNNYRPISNLPLVSKIVERVVANQLHQHFNYNDLYKHFQSGLETTLVKITNKLLCADDSGLLSILILSQVHTTGF